MWDIIVWLPAGIFFALFGWIHFISRIDAKRAGKAWDEEEKRQQVVKDLYPTPPPYEERMGVRYGHDENE